MNKKTHKHKLAVKRQKRKNRDKEIRAEQPINSRDLSVDILDIEERPDVAVWNKVIRKHNFAGAKSVKIGSLNQNLIREDTNNVIDSADVKDVEDAIISETKITDKADLSKTQLNHNDTE